MSKRGTRLRERIMSILLALVMIFSLLPATVFAANDKNPDKFTVYIAGKDGQAIEGAALTYDIKNEGNTVTTGTVNTGTDGYAVISEMSSYSNEITGNKITLSYTVSKGGYQSVTKTDAAVSAVDGNIDIVMQEETPTTAKITVNKSGNGTVKVNSAESDSHTVSIDSTVSVEITPTDNRTYIKSLSIAGNKISVDKYKGYSDKNLKVPQDMAIDVEFVTEYTVTAVNNHEKRGNITLNGTADKSVTVDGGTEVQVQITPNEGYQISSVNIDGTDETVNDRSSFDQRITVNKDITITTSFEKIYSLTVTYDSGNGTVTADGQSCQGGNIVFKEGSKFKVAATPNTNYRVSEVVKNEEVQKFDENDKSYTDEITNMDQDYTYKITFELNTYTVTKNDPQNGKVEMESPTVEYDGNKVVNFIPDEGYVVDKVLVNSVEVDVNAIEGYSGQITINNITANQSIEASFRKITVVKFEQVSFNKNDALKEDTAGGVYVFKDAVTFKPADSNYFIRINSNGLPSNKEQLIDSTVKVESIDISKGSTDRWEKVEIPKNGLYIVVDKDLPEVELTPDKANEFGYYNSNVTISISAQDIAAIITAGTGQDQKEEVIDGGYSGLKQLSYVVKDAGQNPEAETQRGNFNEQDIEDNKGKLKFTVDADKNNSDNIIVSVTAEDYAGNKNTKTLNLKINTAEPTVSVSIDGTLHSEGTKGYYNTNRTAQITIIDRDSCFNESAANDGIQIKASNKKGSVVISKSAMLSEWTHNGDKHTASLTFNTEANYEWVISYKNKAGLTNNSVAETGESVFNFTVDKSVPTGTISVEEKVWDDIVSILTFGIWKDHSVTAEATGKDSISPIYDLKYYKSKSTEALQLAELEDLYKAGKFNDQAYTVNQDELFAVYARITDYAGNTRYIGTNGVVVDATASQITLKPDKANEFGFYNDNVNIEVSVSDCLAGGNDYSGIKSIYYKIENDGKVTQEDWLYEYKVAADDKHPTQKELEKTWDGNIIVDKENNNGDKIRVTVIVVDNAGNKSEEFVNLSINIDKPKVTISVDGKPNRTAEKDGKERGYYKSGRTATIEIEDRASTFHKEEANKAFSVESAINSKGEKINVNPTSMISEWVTEGNKHTATVTFAEDGNYEWTYGGYTNKAYLCMEAPVSKGETPYIFTVDTLEPSGIISVEANVWDKLAEILTFGLYKNKSAQVTASAEDATSPFEMTYYKTSNSTVLSEAELSKKEFKEYKDFNVNPNEQFVIYLKLEDYAGNYQYISTNGFIVDDVPADITLEPEKPNKAGIYGDTKGDIVNVKVGVTDAAPYSGVKTVEYWIEKDGDTENPTQSGTLYEFKVKNPAQSDLTANWNGNISVSKKLNNSCNVAVNVKVTDNAGNTSMDKVMLDIDITHPEIQVTYDNNTDNHGNSYFNSNRKATVAITERTHHFDEKAATKGIKIKAVDSKGKSVDVNLDSMISAWDTKEGGEPDTATHTATISYETDANYTFSISYKDKADNENSSVDTVDTVAPYKFTVDKVAPSGTITAESAEGRKTTWDDLVSKLTFGFWSGKKITISNTAEDLTSPIASVEYFKNDSDSELSLEMVRNLKEWKTFDGLSVTPNEQLTVYLKIVDMAGNTRYISTDGMIADDTAPREEGIAPEIKVSPQQPINGIYKGDVKVAIEVEDPLAGKTYSGLKSVKYRVLNMGQETQAGELYTLTNKAPVKADLQKAWSGEITVDSSINNSNDVVIEVLAEDNAGNTSRDKVSIKIDIRSPEISISYNNNSPDSGHYYNADRVATVVITERNFDPKDVIVNITNTDGTIPALSDWSETAGTGNQDDMTHTATIVYSADGDYTFDIDYTDLADNQCLGETYVSGTANPAEFTIDQTAPVISVGYDNNNAQNGKYFKANRTATITVQEHNFDSGRVQFTQTASISGGAVGVPSASWSSSGDIHTATIAYNADGDYTFDVTMSDMAGNQSQEANYGDSVASKDFTIDTTITEPAIIGVEDGHAYKEEVIPGVDFSDINFNSYELKLTRTRREEKNVDVTEKFITAINTSGQGGSGTFDTFKKIQSNDGIYTLYINILDMAGNEIDKTVVFTVNRFGSVYVYNDYLISLVKDGGAYTQAVEKDLVITEYNADKLLEKSLEIEVTQDGKPLEEVEYQATPEINDKAEVGNSGWYQYQYTIDKVNFSADGVYKMLVASKDATGNMPENTNYKDKDILFRVDSTAPELTSVVGLEDGIINAQEVEVDYTVYDTIGLNSIEVYVDGEQQGDAVDDFKGDMNNYTGTFKLSESSSKQEVRIVAKDMAGNITDTDAAEFTSAYSFNKVVTVSTNALVRWFANKPLFIGTLIGLAVVLGLIWFMIFGRHIKKGKGTV